MYHLKSVGSGKKKLLTGNAMMHEQYCNHSEKNSILFTSKLRYCISDPIGCNYNFEVEFC